MSKMIYSCVYIHAVLYMVNCVLVLFCAVFSLSAGMNEPVADTKQNAWVNNRIYIRRCMTLTSA
jgi:hypothetical protein